MASSLRNSGYVQHFLDVSSTGLHKDEQNRVNFALWPRDPYPERLRSVSVVIVCLAGFRFRSSSGYLPMLIALTKLSDCIFNRFGYVNSWGVSLNLDWDNMYLLLTLDNRYFKNTTRIPSSAVHRLRVCMYHFSTS